MTHSNWNTAVDFPMVRILLGSSPPSLPPIFIVPSKFSTPNRLIFGRARRAAIAQLHPDGAAAAAAEEQRAEAEHSARRPGTPSSAGYSPRGLLHSVSARDTGTTGDSDGQYIDLAESEQECYSSFSGDANQLNYTLNPSIEDPRLVF